MEGWAGLGAGRGCGAGTQPILRGQVRGWGWGLLEGAAGEGTVLGGGGDH